MGKLNANFNEYLDQTSGNPGLYITNNIGNTPLSELIEYYQSGSQDIEVIRSLTNNRQGANIDIVISEDSTTNTVNWLSPEFLTPDGNSRVIKGIKNFVNTITPLVESEIQSHTSFNPSTGAPTNAGFGAGGYGRGLNQILQKSLEADDNNYNYAEHGTGVASLSAGNPSGYATEANVISVVDGFFPSETREAIKFFHQNKPINPQTGVKNPTILIRSIGRETLSIHSFVITGSLVSASFDLDSFLESGTGFRINYAGHDLVFTSGSSETIETESHTKLGGRIYQYSCKNPQLFVDKINNSEMVTSATQLYSLTNFDHPLSMFSASYNSGIFTITSSFGLPSHVRIYSGTLPQLTGSETPSGGHFLTKLTGSEDPGWDIKDWAPNGTPLGLNGVNTYPKNEYGLNIRPYDHHGIENESIYPWRTVWTDGSVGTQGAQREDVLEFRITSDSELEDDRKMADAGIILLNSAGNKPIFEYKSASVDDTYYRPEYNIPSSHPYHTYFVAGKDFGTSIDEDDLVYISRHHNSPAVIDVGNYSFFEDTPEINLAGTRGNAVDIFAPGSLSIGQYVGFLDTGPRNSVTSSTYPTSSIYDTGLLVADPGSYPVLLSNSLNDFTESINNALTNFDALITTQSREYVPSANYTSNLYTPNVITSSSLADDLKGVVYNNRISSFTGTSAAAPLVGGLLALFLEKNPTANVIDCKDYLRNTARVNNLITDHHEGSSDFYYYQYDSINYISASINNGLVTEHKLTGSNVMNESPNRILYNAEFNTQYRDILKVKNNVKFKGGVTYNGNTNTFNLG